MNKPWVTSIVFLCLSCAAAIDTSSSLVNGTQASESNLANISLCLYTGSTVYDYTCVLIANAVDLVDLMNSTKPTIFYIFGWTENRNSTSVATVCGAYFVRGSHNVILVDWAEIAAESYPSAALSVPSAGSAVASGLNKMVAAGLDPTKIHIVGHSLGGQLAGATGRSANFTLPRITGLDPAGPGFYLLTTDLNSADAKFVDIIHTDAGVYGTAENRGTVDFLPNGGGRWQPGCPLVRAPLSDDDFCDHHRSWYYYAESVLNETAFIGVQCDSNVWFRSGFCRSNPRVVMGYATPTTATGKIYLKTNAASPYGRGKAGAN